jgi:hypothetical protein
MWMTRRCGRSYLWRFQDGELVVGPSISVSFWIRNDARVPSHVDDLVGLQTADQKRVVMISRAETFEAMLG